MAGPSSVPVFERFFRSVAQLKVDKCDVKRFRDFVDAMVDDIAIAGRNSARWNNRDVIAPMNTISSRAGSVDREPFSVSCTTTASSCPGSPTSSRTSVCRCTTIRGSCMIRSAR